MEQQETSDLSSCSSSELRRRGKGKVDAIPTPSRTEYCDVDLLPYRYGFILRHSNIRQPSRRSFCLKLLHWGPMIALTLVLQITVSTANCHLKWWPPRSSSPGAVVHFFWMWSYLLLALANFFWSLNHGPGFVPLGWLPPNESDCDKLQFCLHCRGYKPPRSHHCSKCARCVLRMDHHCPWINNCVGHENQAAFVRFLIYTVVGSFHSLFVSGPTIYRALFFTWYLYYGDGSEPLVPMGVVGMLGAVFSFALALAVVIAVGFLFVIQIRSVVRNRTGIEDYIVDKAVHRREEEERDKLSPFLYPYDMGTLANLGQVFPNFVSLFTEPSRLDVADNGYVWPLIDGCHEFSFTLEQIEQKQLKRRVARQFVAAEPYNGRLCSCRHGFMVFLCQPLVDGEPALALATGQRIMVTRYTKRWLYGELVVQSEEQENDGHENEKKENWIRQFDRKPKLRGWFPGRCVCPVTYQQKAAVNDVDAATTSPSEIRSDENDQFHN